PAVNGQRVHYRVGNRANLARVVARANQKIIGEPRGLPQIQYDEIDALLVKGGADRRIELLREAFEFPVLFSLGHATRLPPCPAVRRSHAGEAASTYKVRVAQCVAARHRARARQLTLRGRSGR